MKMPIVSSLLERQKLFFSPYPHHSCILKNFVSLFDTVSQQHPDLNWDSCLIQILILKGFSFITMKNIWF